MLLLAFHPSSISQVPLSLPPHSLLVSLYQLWAVLSRGPRERLWVGGQVICRCQRCNLIFNPTVTLKSYLLLGTIVRSADGC